jgi:hypothetical protein
MTLLSMTYPTSRRWGQLSKTHFSFMFTINMLQGLFGRWWATRSILGSARPRSPETVARERLTAGDYTVRWEGAGPSVQLRIMQRTKVVMAAAPAKLVALESVSPSDSVILEIDGNGSWTLSQISFSRKRFALQIGEGSATAAIRVNN